jgi:TATA-binding protein-associated factor
MDRAHRIGQKKTVNVYKLVTVDSIEEKIMKLHETKLAMSNAIVNAENSTLYSMGTDQLLDIFRFRSENSDSKAKATENNLDALVERYEDEYASLFVGNFIKTFKGHNELS